MALTPLKFKPGINRDQSNYSNEGGWWDGDKIRFRQGYPQKIGGFIKASPMPFIGVCRQLWNWITTYRDNFMALGTNQKVYIEAGSIFYDITPIRDTFVSPDTDNCVATELGSTTVTLSVTAHGAVDGAYVNISGVTGDVGGVPDAEINATHKITLVDSSTFTIEVDTAATTTVAAGGGTSIEVSFQINPGNANITEGYGWGTSSWGEIPWGLGSESPVFLPQRDWWFDNIDNDLVMNIRNGPIYYWARGTNSTPSVALDTPAVLLSSLAGASDVPVAAMQVLISQNDRHLLAFGCVPFGSTDITAFDPLLIRWTNQDEPENWTPTPLNTAGFIRVSRGNRIVRALPTRQEILVFTDSHLYSLTFLGTTDVFGLQEYADNISIMSPRGCISANNVTYWMGKDKFYFYDGRVNTLPCTVREYVFQDLNYDRAEEIVCGTNEEWNEIWWFYPSKNGTTNNRYVVYNHFENLWYFGTFDKTAWLQTGLRRNPHSVITDENNEVGYMYLHEFGTDADGEPLEAFIRSTDVDLQGGDKFMLMSRMLPDVSFFGSETDTPEVTLEVMPRNFPGTSFREDPTDAQRVVATTIDRYTDQLFIRARARQMALRISSDTKGVYWQLGTPRVDIKPDGKR